MIDLCKIFGVEEKEEFKIIHKDYKHFVYTISNNILWCKDKHAETFTRSSLCINNLDEIIEIIKLPKKKEFTVDELCILRNIDKGYKWIARDEDDKGMFAYEFKPTKGCYSWIDGGDSASIYGFNHLFQSIKWEDEEPVYIDDYVERGAE